MRIPIDRISTMRKQIRQSNSSDKSAAGAAAGRASSPVRKSDNGREVVQSFVRGVAVVRAFGPGADRLTLSQIAERSGMPPAAARRFLMTLLDLGYADTDGRLFFLRPRILELGYAYLASLSWWNEAHPHLQKVSQVTGETCSASVLDDTDILYVARAVSLHIMTASLNIGSKLPAYATAMGRAVLAWQAPDELDAWFALSNRKRERRRKTERTLVTEADLRRELRRVREQGYCIVDEEVEIGLRSIGVPLLSMSGRVVASIGVSVYAARATVREMLREMLPPLQEAARAIRPAIPG